jgi:hypothetical protein
LSPEEHAQTLAQEARKPHKKGAIEDAAALEAQATGYARWLAERDKIALPIGSTASPVWSDFKNGTKAKRISAVLFGDVVVNIPNWDFVPSCVRASS